MLLPCSVIPTKRPLPASTRNYPPTRLPSTRLLIALKFQKALKRWQIKIFLGCTGSPRLITKPTPSPNVNLSRKYAIVTISTKQPCSKSIIYAAKSLSPVNDYAFPIKPSAISSCRKAAAELLPPQEPRRT